MNSTRPLPMHLIIVSGLSGSGKSVALHMLEDIDYYCVDNIPAALLKPLISHIIRGSDGGLSPRRRRPRCAQPAAGDRHHTRSMVDELRRSGITATCCFLHAREAVLLKRYAETRRKHPLIAAGISLREAIEAKRTCSNRSRAPRI